MASAYFDSQEVDAARLDNRRVLVTGANSGIGLACCQDLAKRGAEVHMVCRNLERGQKARETVIRATGDPETVCFFPSVHSITLSLAKRGAEVHMVCRNLERGQKARETVIRATGDPETPVYLHQVDLSQPRKVFEFARTFEAEQEGLDILPRVIVVSSGGMLLQQLNHSDPMLVQKRTHFDGAMVYAQNKRQQVVMTEMWAERYGDIRFSCMHPGWVDTPAVAFVHAQFSSPHAESSAYACPRGRYCDLAGHHTDHQVLSKWFFLPGVVALDLPERSIWFCGRSIPIDY
ncbi:hypothetical protein AHF37_03886 [Paragonimus kellicotti]|nr:hypothetical protein AHF37_03886 [Paragonimus kellicotti]